MKWLLVIDEIYFWGFQQTLSSSLQNVE